MGNGAAKAARRMPDPALFGSDLEGEQNGPVLEQCDSPVAAGSPAPDLGESDLLKLRDAVGKSVRHLEEKIVAQGTKGKPFGEEDLGELKDALEAAEGGVERVHEATTRYAEAAVNRSAEVMRKSSHETVALRARLHTQAEAMKSWQQTASDLQADREKLRGEVLAMIAAQHDMLAQLEAKQHQISAQAAENAAAKDSMESQTAFLRELAMREHMRGRELRGQLLQARGSVRVLCRIRPLLDSESTSRASPALTVTGNETVMLKIPHSADKMYKMDRILGPDAGQDVVFKEVLGLAESVVDGNSAALILYGARRTGKAFTTLGTAQTPGMLMLGLGEIFNLAEDRKPFLEVAVAVSMLLIDDMRTWDLLGPGGSSPGPVSDSVQPVQADSLADAIQLLDTGLNAISESPCRDADSYSMLHTVFVTTSNLHTGQVTSGKLQVVQVAPCKADGQRTSPDSVVPLGDCMIAGLKNQSIEWDNSVLTMLLRDSLEGPMPRAVVIATVSPGSQAISESVATLNFASRVYNATRQGQQSRPASTLDNLQVAKSFSRRRSQEGSQFAVMRSTSLGRP